MSLDVTDPQFFAKLAAAREIAEVRSPEGRLLGLFTPRCCMVTPQADRPMIVDMAPERPDTPRTN